MENQNQFSDFNSTNFTQKESITPILSRNYLLMCLANLLLSAAVYSQLMFVLRGAHVLSSNLGILPISVFVLGTFVLGPFHSYMVDTFHRKHVALLSVIGLVVASLLWHFLNGMFSTIITCLVLGSSFSTFEMSVGATLVNDLADSKNRTASDYYFIATSLIGISVGLGLANLSCYYGNPISVSTIIIPSGILAMFFILLVRVPFRAPVKASLFSTDRFFTLRPIPLIINLLTISVVTSLYINIDNAGHALLLLVASGVFMGFITHRLFFAEADHRADAVAGLALMIIAMVMLCNPMQRNFETLAYVLLGMGMGWFICRMLMYFLKTSAHCQRGTLQHTCLLVIVLGNAIGMMLSHYNQQFLHFLTLGLCLFALCFYLLVTHPWFLKKNNRDFKFREV